MEDIRIFLLVGQSNMAGRGNLNDVEPIRNGSCRVLRNGKWQPMTEPVCVDRSVDARTGGVMSGVGPSASFADCYSKAHPGVVVGLVPCADGGTRIAEWQPGEALFDHAVMQTRLAMRTGKLCGILWHQGESDTCDDKHIAAYREKFLTMANALREELCAQNIPFIMGEIGWFVGKWSDSSPEGVAAMNGIQRSIAAEFEHYGFVSCEGLTHKGDSLHFDAKSQREFGRRYFEEFERVSCKKEASVN